MIHQFCNSVVDYNLGYVTLKTVHKSVFVTRLKNDFDKCNLIADLPYAVQISDRGHVNKMVVMYFNSR